MEHHNVVNELALCIVFAWLLGVVAQLLKQPLILAYLAAGFFVGPVGIGWVKDPAAIEGISSLGLILLLFMIGLEIDLKTILGAGRLITITGFAQVAGGCCLGILLFAALGFPMTGGSLDAVYLGVAAALSSTVIIVKLLYEKRELDTLPGRVTLGILVLQDLFAILFLAIQPDLKSAGFAVLGISLLKVVVLVAVALVVSRYLLPPLFKAVARLPELVLVGALAWCFLVAGLASYMHLSREMGALVAGVAISTFPYTLDVSAKVTSIRDFFVTLFFVALGMSVPAPNATYIGWALALSAFVVASRFLTMIPPLHWMKQGHRASIIPTLNLCQISELSLVILALGFSFKHISEQTKGIVSYAFIFLAVGSTYAIVQNDALSRWLGRILTRLGLRDLNQEGAAPDGKSHHASADIFFLGFFRTASSLLESIQRQSPHLLSEIAVVDFSPQVNEELRKRGVKVIYGDISQRDTLLHAGVGKAKVIVCTLPNSILKGATNLRLLRQLREISPDAQIIVHAELIADVPALYAAGASYVFVPRVLEGAELCGVIQAARARLLDQKRAELDGALKNRQEVIP